MIHVNSQEASGNSTLGVGRCWQNYEWTDAGLFSPAEEKGHLTCIEEETKYNKVQS